MDKSRLDVLLAEINLSTSRQKTLVLIRAGEIIVDRKIIDQLGSGSKYFSIPTYDKNI
ncbi:MAG: hypothetical protein F6K40_32925 [Okeania sp. SIO3I5]|uniref:hypothetical protein n=1 Tax=Okeania sp. SIO3I5 TaxID=2607805 RepID=UPI0013B68A6F|nr:hypothetical protein [Okeania sp. SIO3I5]NEQ40767.1 hypothetical protein [Okeania sp. SIO3I5]